LPAQWRQPVASLKPFSISKIQGEKVIESRVICPYCNKPAKFYETSERFYRGEDFGPVWACVPCDARVGCHKGTDNPLGRLATDYLRKLKMRVHGLLDPVWKAAPEAYTGPPLEKPKRICSLMRSRCYRWLAWKMGIEYALCHVGMFSEGQCIQAIDILKQERPTPQSVRAWAKEHGW